LLPQLRRLEHKYADELVVIGVHSAKFPTEQATANVRQAVMRLSLDHPVINDADFRVWQEYAVRAWPTIMFLDPEGRVVGKHEGEAHFEALDRALAEMVRQYDAAGLLTRAPLDLNPERPPEGYLRYLGKVLADAASRRLVVADSGHHRLVVADLDGRVQQVVGSGEPGRQDGPLDTARFHGPQGLALDGDTLYVADTENHAIRAVDLAAGTVKTLAGTGEQATSRMTAGPGRLTALRSPWDLALGDGRLYVAMAGSHQLWALDLAQGTIAPFAGAGPEGLRDGPRAEAHLAQPSGLALDGATVYFADSETSSIRVLDLAADTVRTLVGLGLFEFGDADGVGDAVRLQHPLAVAVRPDGGLIVADTYNHRLKLLDPRTRACAAWVGSGEPGHRDEPGLAAQFYEPSGLSLAADTLYVADTNNHAIRTVDLATGVVRTLDLRA
jgi:sugar lactone lactonase YvrE